MFCVYKLTSPNHKVYIGITGGKPERRWNSGYGYGKNTHLAKAIRHFGWDNFKHEIIMSGLTKEEACTKEKELIKQYKSTDQRYGYNHSTGGECPALGSTHSEATKRRMSLMRKGKNAYWYGKKRSEADRKKMSEAHKGKPMHENTRKALLYAISHPSEETRRKISETSKGRLPANSKKVICVETGKVYKSTLEAERDTSVLHTSISKVCHKKPMYYTAGGFHWEFYKKD